MSTSDSGDISSYSGDLPLPGMSGDGYEPPAPSAPAEELPPLTDYGQRFLQNIPEEKRADAEQWVRQWDGGVAKLRGKYEADAARFTNLGSYEDIQAGVQLFRMLTGGPDQQQEIADYLAENGITPKQFADAVKKQQETVTGEKPDPYAERLDKHEKAVVALAEQQQRFIAETQQQKALREYNDLLDNAAKEHGEFDRRYASYLLSTDQAKTLEEAVHMCHLLKPPTRRAAAPNLLGGSGSAPHHGGKKPDFAGMSEKDIGNYLVARLSGE